MKKNIFNILIISFVTILFGSCSKTDTTPQTCYLSNIANAKGNVLEKYTYDANNRLINDTSDSTGLTYAFAYNTQNQMDKISITQKNGTKTFTFIVTFSYDATGNPTKAVTSLNGNTYQTNVFSYTNTLLTTIVTTDFQSELLTTRLVYSGDNIAKVYQKFGTEPEYLYYEITKFDDKKNSYPEAYKALALGLTGLIDGFIYLNKNNALLEKTYGDDNVVYYTSDNTYEYNSTLQPTKITSAINDDGYKSTEVRAFSYNCK